MILKLFGETELTCFCLLYHSYISDYELLVYKKEEERKEEEEGSIPSSPLDCWLWTLNKLVHVHFQIPCLSVSVQ